MKDGGAEPGDLGDGSPPAGSRGRAPVGVWGQSPQKLTTYYENNCQKHRLLVGRSKNNEIEGFGGRPPVGGRPGARGPPGPPKSGPVTTSNNATVQTSVVSCRDGIINRTVMCAELSADSVTQTPAATHQCHCPSHPTAPADTHFTLLLMIKIFHS